MGTVTAPPETIIQAIKDAAGLHSDDTARWPAIAKVVYRRATRRGDTRFIPHAEALALQQHRERSEP